MSSMSRVLIRWRRVLIESDTCLCARRTSARVVIGGKGRRLALEEASDGVFFGVLCSASKQLLGDQKPVGRDSQAGMMMESSPASSLVVSQSQLLLELLIVALDAPAQMCHTDQLVERGVLGQRRQPILGRLRFARGPLDEQPLLRPQARPPEVSPGMAHAHRSEAP